MRKVVVLKHQVWDRIWDNIKKEYVNTPAVYLIRSRMKERLGFTHREHEEWASEESLVTEWRDYRSQIHIDFYSESARTMFLLKYSDIINDKSNK